MENYKKIREKMFKKNNWKEKMKIKKKNVDDMEEQKENLKSLKSMKTKEKVWARRRWNKVIKEKVMVIKKKKYSKIMENKKKSNN